MSMCVDPKIFQYRLSHYQLLLANSKASHIWPHEPIFQPTGVGTTQSTLSFCRASPLGQQERQVTIGPTGGASVKNDDDWFMFVVRVDKRIASPPRAPRLMDAAR